MKQVHTGMYVLRRFSRLLMIGMLLALFASTAYAVSPASHRAAHADTGCVEHNAVSYQIISDDSSYASWNGASVDLWPCISYGPSTLNYDAYVSFNGSITYNNPYSDTYLLCALEVNLYKVGVSDPVDYHDYNCSDDFVRGSHGLYYDGAPIPYDEFNCCLGSGQYWVGVRVDVRWIGADYSPIDYEVGTDIQGSGAAQVG